MRKEKQANREIQLDCHPRQKPSGMTPNLNNAPSSWRKRTEFIGSGVRGKVAHGFTLIELLVVVLIIGTLAAVALPQYQFVVAKSRFTQAKVLAKSIADAEEVYYLANGKYTNDFDNLDIAIGGKKEEHFPQSRYYEWGNCSLEANDAGRADTTCWVKVPSGEVAYWIGAKHSTYDTNRKCLASGSTAKPSTTDISYRICSQDTNNLFVGSFGVYTYYWNYK